MDEKTHLKIIDAGKLLTPENSPAKLSRSLSNEQLRSQPNRVSATEPRDGATNHLWKDRAGILSESKKKRQNNIRDFIHRFNN